MYRELVTYTLAGSITVHQFAGHAVPHVDAEKQVPDPQVQIFQSLMAATTTPAPQGSLWNRHWMSGVTE